VKKPKTGNGILILLVKVQPDKSLLNLA